MFIPDSKILYSFNEKLADSGEIKHTAKDD